jgi:hypothetical protein
MPVITLPSLLRLLDRDPQGRSGRNAIVWIASGHLPVAVRAVGTRPHVLTHQAAFALHIGLEMLQAKLSVAMAREAVSLLSRCELDTLFALGGPAVMARGGRVTLQQDPRAVPEGEGRVVLIFVLGGAWPAFKRRLDEYRGAVTAATNGAAATTSPQSSSGPRGGCWPR